MIFLRYTPLFSFILNAMIRQSVTFLGMIWASPYTIFGILASLIIPGRKGSITLWNENIEIRHFSGPVFYVCKKLGISAFTLGNTIIYTIEPHHQIRLHEYRHTQQYYVLGPFFLPLYYLFLAMYGYHNHPFEKDARDYENKKGDHERSP